MLKRSAKFIFIFTILNSFVIQNYANASTINLTLKEAIKLGLKNNIEIKKSNFVSEKAALKKNNNLKNIFIPTFQTSVSASTKWINSNIQSKKSQFEYKERSIFSSKVSYDILSIPKKNARYIVDKRDFELTNTNHRKLIERIIEEIIQKYYNLLIGKKKLEVLDNSFSLSKQNLDTIEKRYKLGTSSKLEYFEAKINFNDAYNRLLNQKQDLAIAKFSLLSTLNLNVKDDIDIYEKIEEFEQLEWQNILESFEKNNSSLKLLSDDLKLSKAKYDKESLKLILPDIKTYVEFGLFKNDEGSNSLKNPMVHFGIGLDLSLNLARIINAIDNAKIAKIDYNSKMLLHSTEIDLLKLALENNFEIYKSYLERIKTSKSALEATKENLKMEEFQFKNGSIDLLKLNMAIQKEREASFELLNTILTAKKYENKIKKMAGMLIKEFYGA